MGVGAGGSPSQNYSLTDIVTAHQIAILMQVLAKHRSRFVRHRSRDMSWVETWVGVSQLENIVCFQRVLNPSLSAMDYNQIKQLVES